MSYLDFYGLTAEPFSNAPVSRFYFNAPQHQQALTRLLYAANSMKGLAVLIGDIGAGKTTLARRMLDALPEEEYEAALLVIIHSGITASWILRRIALQLGVENPAQEKLALLSQLYQRLLQIYEQGRKAVVLIDEAQMLETRELMEEFRGLLNLEVPERKLISFVFFGLPEIERNLKLDPPLAQRVAMRYRLEPFHAESTEAYIKHRLRLAGSTRLPFSPDALQAIHRRSLGTPRVINTLCDNALFEGFLAKSADIRGTLIEHIADNLGLETAPSSSALNSPAGASIPPAVRRDPEAAHTAARQPHAAGSSSQASIQAAQHQTAPYPIVQPPNVATVPEASVTTRPSGTASSLSPPVAPRVSPSAPAPAPTAPGGVPSTPAPGLSDVNIQGASPPKRTGVDLAEIDRYLEGLGKL